LLKKSIDRLKNEKNLKRLIGKAGGSLSLKISKSVLSFGTSIILARVLGDERYGLYAYVISWAMIIVKFVVVGLPNLVTREVARRDSQSDITYVKSLDLFSNITSITLSLLFGGALVLTVTYTSWLNIKGESELYYWIIILVPIIAIIRLRKAVLRGEKLVVYSLIPSASFIPFVFLLVIGVIWVLGVESVHHMLGGRLLAAALGLVLIQYIYQKQTSWQLYKSRFSVKKKWLQSMVPLFIISTESVISKKIGTVALGLLVGSSSAGIYNICMKGATIAKFIVTAINLPLAPKISKLWSKNKIKELRTLIFETSTITFAAGAAICTMLIMFGQTYLALFGPSFIEGYSILSVLVIGQLANCFIASAAPLLIMTDNETDVAVGKGVLSVLNIVLTIVLTYYIGTLGAAVATATTITAWNVMLAIWAFYKVKIDTTAFSTLSFIVKPLKN